MVTAVQRRDLRQRQFPAQRVIAMIDPHPQPSLAADGPVQKTVRRLKVGIRDIQAVPQQVCIGSRQLLIPAFSRDDRDIAGDPAAGYRKAG